MIFGFLPLAGLLTSLSKLSVIVRLSVSDTVRGTGLNRKVAPLQGKQERHNRKRDDDYARPRCTIEFRRHEVVFHERLPGVGPERAGGRLTPIQLA